MTWLPSAGPIVNDELKFSSLVLSNYKRMRHALACVLAYGLVGGFFCLCSAPWRSAWSAEADGESKARYPSYFLKIKSPARLCKLA